MNETISIMIDDSQGYFKELRFEYEEEYVNIYIKDKFIGSTRLDILIPLINRIKEMWE